MMLPQTSSSNVCRRVFASLALRHSQQRLLSASAIKGGSNGVNPSAVRINAFKAALMAPETNRKQNRNVDWFEQHPCCGNGFPRLWF